MNPSFFAEKPLGYVQGTSLAAAATAASLFPGGAIPAGTTRLRVLCETQAVRWRDDGTAPTATVGMPLAVATELNYDQKAFAALQFIEQTASAKINITAYGQS